MEEPMHRHELEVLIPPEGRPVTERDLLVTHLYRKVRTDACPTPCIDAWRVEIRPIRSGLPDKPWSYVVWYLVMRCLNPGSTYHEVWACEGAHRTHDKALSAFEASISKLGWQPE